MMKKQEAHTAKQPHMANLWSNLSRYLWSFYFQVILSQSYNKQRYMLKNILLWTVSPSITSYKIDGNLMQSSKLIKYMTLLSK